MLIVDKKKRASGDDSVCRRHRQPAWVGLRRTSLLQQHTKYEQRQKVAAELLSKESHATASLIAVAWLMFPTSALRDVLCKMHPTE